MFPWHCLNFLPDPHGHFSFLPTFLKSEFFFWSKALSLFSSCGETTMFKFKSNFIISLLILANNPSNSIKASMLYIFQCLAQHVISTYSSSILNFQFHMGCSILSSVPNPPLEEKVTFFFVSPPPLKQKKNIYCSSAASGRLGELPVVPRIQKKNQKKIYKFWKNIKSIISS